MQYQGVPISKTAILQIMGEVNQEPVDDHDDKLANLSDDIKWQTLKKDIEEEISRLEQTIQISSEMSVEQIGFRFIAVKLAQDKLRWVIDRVERTREVRDRPEST